MSTPAELAASAARDERHRARRAGIRSGGTAVAPGETPTEDDFRAELDAKGAALIEQEREAAEQEAREAEERSKAARKAARTRRRREREAEEREDAARSGTLEAPTADTDDEEVDVPEEPTREEVEAQLPATDTGPDKAGPESATDVDGAEKTPAADPDPVKDAKRRAREEKG